MSGHVACAFEQIGLVPVVGDVPRVEVQAIPWPSAVALRPAHHRSETANIVVTRRDSEAGWLDERGGAKAQARFSLPITHVLASDDGSLAAPRE